MPSRSGSLSLVKGIPDKLKIDQMVKWSNVFPFFATNQIELDTDGDGIADVTLTSGFEIRREPSSGRGHSRLGWYH